MPLLVSREREIEDYTELPRAPSVGDFRALLPKWAYPEEVAKLALEHAEVARRANHDGIIPLTCACGPAVRWTRRATVLAIVFKIGLFVATNHLTFCEGRSARYPSKLWIVVFGVAILRVVMELAAVQYSLIPYVQVEGGFKVMRVKVVFQAWLLFNLMKSLLYNSDDATDVFFASVTFKQIECNPELNGLWETVLSQSMFGFSSVLSLRMFVGATYVLTFAQLIYPLWNVQPACGEKPDFVVGHDKFTKSLASDDVPAFNYKWQNLSGDAMNTGDAMFILSEAAGMATLAGQGLEYPKGKQKRLTEEETLNGSPMDVSRHLMYIHGAITRGITRVGLVGLLENSIQIHLQICLFALMVSSQWDPKAARQAGASIGLSIIMSLIKLAEGFQVLSFSLPGLTEVSNNAAKQDQDALQEGKDAVDQTLIAVAEQRARNDAQVYRTLRAQKVLIAFEILCAASLLLAGVKLCAIFVCPDSMWQLSGCVNLPD